MNDYKQATTLIAASCFGLTTVVLAYLWRSNVMRRREFETSFGQMAEEMSFRVDDEVPEAIR